MENLTNIVTLTKMINPDNDLREYDIEIITLDKEICDIYISAENMAEIPEVGSEIVTVSNPGVLSWHYAEGILSETDLLFNLSTNLGLNINLLSIELYAEVGIASIFASGGSSGGGVYSNNKFVGVTFGASTNNSIMLFVSARYLKTHLNNNE